MLGTIVNALAIVVCTLVGMALKGGIPEKYRTILVQALGLSVVYIGATSAIGNLLSENTHPLLYILSLVIGAFFGELVDIEGKLQQFGDFMEKKSKKANSNISQGFVTASLIYCVGSMAILGAIESGIHGDHSILYAKSLLDGVMSLVLASTLGIGVMLSGVSVLLYQGTITLFASSLQPYITEDMMREVSIVGGVLISVIGLNLLEITKIKVGNFLPAIFIPVIYMAFA